MDYQVPVLSVVFMIATMLAGIALPVGLFKYLRKKYGCKPMVFFTGVLVMLVFALILEQIVHYFVLTSAFGIIMQSNIWAYGFYGGLMAGLFEETGRFIAFGTILYRNNSCQRLTGKRWSQFSLANQGAERDFFTSSSEGCTSAPST